MQDLEGLVANEGFWAEMEEGPSDTEQKVHTRDLTSTQLSDLIRVEAEKSTVGTDKVPETQSGHSANNKHVFQRDQRPGDSHMVPTRLPNGNYAYVLCLLHCTRVLIGPEHAKLQSYL